MRRAASTSEPRRRRGPWLLVWLAFAAGCAPTPETHERDLTMLGDRVRVDLRGVDAAGADATAAALRDTFAGIDGEWHAWHDSGLTRVNRALAAGEPATASPSLLALVDRARPLVAASDGLFDPAVGRLVATWGFHTDDFPIGTPVPADDILDAWRAERPTLADLRRDGDRLSSPRRDLQLDFGAISEGMAAVAALDVLRARGVAQARVSFGGDAVALGDGGGVPWQASVRDPFGGVLATVDLGDGEALFASGNFNRFRTSPAGARWSHILDPRTGRPARGAAAVAVLAGDPVLADAAAAAIFVAGPAGFEHIARRMGVACVVMVTEENEMLATRAMQARLRMRRVPVPLGAPLDLGDTCR